LLRWCYTCTPNARMDHCSNSRGMKSWGLDAIYGDKESWTARNLVYRLIVELLGWFGWSICVQFTLLYLYIICVLSFLPSFWFYSSSICVFFLRFCGYIFCKASRNLTRPLGGTEWFKGLVAYAKCNCDSYESELGL